MIPNYLVEFLCIDFLNPIVDEFTLSLWSNILNVDRFLDANNNSRKSALIYKHSKL